MNRIRPNERVIEENGERYAISIFSGNGKLYDQMQIESPDILAPRRGSLVYRHLGSIAGEHSSAVAAPVMEAECAVHGEAILPDIGVTHPEVAIRNASPEPMSEYLRLADANL